MPEYKGAIRLHLYLASAPDRLFSLQLPPTQIACAAYGIEAGSHLSRQPIPVHLPGGLMLLNDESAYTVENPDRLCREIIEECIRRRYGGAVLDFAPSPAAGRIALIRQLDTSFRQRNLKLFVPEYYGGCIRCGTVLICTALSGGTLRRRLTEAAARFAPRPIALDCQRLAMDFPIPAPGGEGTPLAPGQLRQLKEGRSVFFSEDLCARYFTYRTVTGARFVLFDDADTLLRKVWLGAELGAAAAFFTLPEVADLLTELFER